MKQESKKIFRSANQLTAFLYRHRSLLSILALLLLIAAAVALWLSYQIRRIEPFLRDRIVAQISERFHARVELDKFHISLIEGLEAEGSGLRIWPHDSTGTTPLISLKHFSFHADANIKHLALLVIQNQGQLEIPSIELKGLSIHLPPHSHFAHLSNEPASPATPQSHLTFRIDKITCTDATLLLETDKPNKDPLEFAIQSIIVTDITANSPIHYQATLHIPRPDGSVQTTGSFGPANFSDLGESPLSGDYTLSNANLGVFKGIGGILSSTGHYTGTIRTLDVQGDATVPDFRLTHFGNQLPLATHFNAQVDGTNGDTRLDTVTATLGHSHFTVHGEIARVKNPPNSTAPNGHEINLTTASTTSRIEDFLHLTSNKPSSLLTGSSSFNANFHLPPGPAHVHERMQINGNIHITDAHFTSQNIQSRIMELSLRGQGRPDEIKTTNPETIDSSIVSDLQIANGQVTLPNLVYSVPGAEIEMKGTYFIDGGALNFAGTAKLDAPISKIVGGKYGKFLAPMNKLLEREGAGTFIPIHIDGNREDPHFAIEFKQLLKP